MKKQNKKALQLETQTIRNLDGATLGRAAGGTGATDERTWCLPCGGTTSTVKIECTM